MSELYKYEHPYITVDGVVLRFRESLEVLLMQRAEEPEAGKWSLPGGFMNIDTTLDRALESKVTAKTGVSGFYMEQLKTYDAIDRDPRGRILSVAYLALFNGNDVPGDWFEINREKQTLACGEGNITFKDLAFDHGLILADALDRLRNKLWYSDLMRYLLPDKFPIRDVKRLLEECGCNAHKMLRRDLGTRIVETNELENHVKWRPAALFYWNPDWKGD